MVDAKRAVDLALELPALFLSLPVQAVVAIAVRHRLGSPVLFRQVRPGLHGVASTLVKFRAMLDPDPTQALATDKEGLTPFGSFLRSTSLDEPPALNHVVRGQMALVGRQPLLVRCLDRYTPEQARRREVRPGLTGPARVSGHNATSWERRLALDVEHADTLSLGLGLRTIAKTITEVLTRRDVSGDGTPTMTEFMGRIDGKL